MTSARSTKEAPRFEALDGLRGVCALMVVALHLPLSGWLQEVTLFRHAFLFVDFFFVLSGFVIAHSYAGRIGTAKDFGRFALSRLRRVYPLHLFMLVLFLVFEVAAFLAKGPDAAFQGGNALSALGPNLFLVHAFGTVPSLGWNYPSWSISAEFGAYLLFGAGLLVLGPRRLPAALLLVALAAVAVLFQRVGHLDVTVSFGWLRCFAGFACGAFLRLVLAPGVGADATPSPARATLAEIAVAVFVAMFVAKAGATPLSLAAPFVFALAVAVFAHEAGAVSRLLRSPECAFLGLVSYSIYMTHAFVIARAINVGTVVENRTGLDIVETLADGSKAFSPVASPLAFTATLVGTVLLSALTWRFVERPGQRLRVLSRPAAEAVPASP